MASCALFYGAEGFDLSGIPCDTPHKCTYLLPSESLVTMLQPLHLGLDSLEDFFSSLMQW